MKSFLIFVICFEASVLCAMVREFPFALLNDSDISETSTTVDEVTAMTTLISEVVEHIMHLEDETQTNETSPDLNSTWSTEATPILSALRNFWFQAKSGLMDPIDQFPEDSLINGNSENLLKAIEHGLIEATTMLVNRIEETTLATSPSKEQELEPESNVFTKRQGEAKPPNLSENLETKPKRQTAFDLMANMSSSCTNCYENLKNCVQRCFAENNCNDVKRKVRVCPPIPNRLCSFFTQWSPVDECVSHSDCKSPLLCCNDGCGNKCAPGVWRS